MAISSAGLQVCDDFSATFLNKFVCLCHSNSLRDSLTLRVFNCSNFLGVFDPLLLQLFEFWTLFFRLFDYLSHLTYLSFLPIWRLNFSEFLLLSDPVTCNKTTTKFQHYGIFIFHFSERNFPIPTLATYFTNTLQFSSILFEQFFKTPSLRDKRVIIKRTLSGSIGLP